MQKVYIEVISSKRVLDSPFTPLISACSELDRAEAEKVVFES